MDLKVLLDGYKAENDSLLKKIASLALANKSLEARLSESVEHKVITDLKTENENLLRVNGILKAEILLRDDELKKLREYVSRPWYKRIFSGQETQTL